MLVKRVEHPYMNNIEPFLQQHGVLDFTEIAALLSALDSGSLSTSGLESASPSPDDEAPPLNLALSALSKHGFLEFVTPDLDALTLTPCSRYFVLDTFPPLTEGVWKLSKFTYFHLEGDQLIVRSPTADCFVKIRGDDALALVHAFRKPTCIGELLGRMPQLAQAATMCGALARANIILPCDAGGTTADDRDAARRQWCFHDLLFHSMSRLGRSEKEIGGTYRFKDQIECPPAIKAHPWTSTIIPLPEANIEALMLEDVPLTRAMEQRRSIRKHSVVPLSKQELGEFLFRVARVRRRYQNEHGEFTSRPYPSGGGLYEHELYLTIEACTDIERGFYYYDPVAHALCLVSPPSADTAGLLDDAYMATALQGRPQVLVTIASRFNRFNWKYASMAYCAQLKNIGVLYQTMYLVATSIGMAACALGLGDSDRFARITGLDYLEEGSMGELMLGRPL